MVSGQSFSEDEKEYTRKNIRDKSKCQIAKELGRNVITVRRFLKREGFED